MGQCLKIQEQRLLPRITGPSAGLGLGLNVGPDSDPAPILGPGLGPFSGLQQIDEQL